MARGRPLHSLADHVCVCMCVCVAATPTCLYLGPSEVLGLALHHDARLVGVDPPLDLHVLDDEGGGVSADE
jgi:hypothetical protein